MRRNVLNTKNKILTFILVAAMTFTSTPIHSVFAEEVNGVVTEDVSQKETSDGESQNETTDGEDQKAPVEGEDQKAPAEGENQKEPVEGEGQREPAEGEDQKEPAEGEDQKEPAEGEGQKEPVEGENQEEPAEGENQEAPDATVKEIKWIEATSSRTYVEMGGTFSAADLKVEGVYEDGSKITLSSDDYKISELADRKGLDMPEFTHTADGLIVGVVDATLAMMSALVAAESLGLGTCPIGYARTAAPEETSKILELPEKVFVVCGLAIGVPREMPDIKPKQQRELMIFSNKYKTEKLVSELEAYDEVISNYNRTRSGGTTTNDWVSHILGYYREAMSYHMLDALRRRGFDVKR